MNTVKKAKAPTLHTIDSLEYLASRLLVGGDGDFNYFDRAPPSPHTIKPGDVAMFVATMSKPFQWALFFAKYLANENARTHFQLWIMGQLKKSGIPDEHWCYLSDMATKAYCDGSTISGRRIAKRLKAGRNNTVPRYVEILDRILYTASVSEEELGRKVWKMSQ